MSSNVEAYPTLNVSSTSVSSQLREAALSVQQLSGIKFLTVDQAVGTLKQSGWVWRGIKETQLKDLEKPYAM